MSFRVIFALTNSFYLKIQRRPTFLLVIHLRLRLTTRPGSLARQLFLHTSGFEKSYCWVLWLWKNLLSGHVLNKMGNQNLTNVLRSISLSRYVYVCYFSVMSNLESPLNRFRSIRNNSVFKIFEYFKSMQKLKVKWYFCVFGTDFHCRFLNEAKVTFLQHFISIIFFVCFYYNTLEMSPHYGPVPILSTSQILPHWSSLIAIWGIYSYHFHLAD